MRHISLNLSERELEVLQDALQQMREYESVRYAKVVREDGQSEAVQSILERSKAMQEVQKQIADGGTGDQEAMPLTVYEIRLLETLLMEGKYQLGKKRIALQEDGCDKEAAFYAACEELGTRVLLNLSDRERALRQRERQ